ncbi:MAG: aspartate ammonia-lyase [Candidatus Diapherotrites archaeon]|uniref:Aspartate ammonia-lyase n=1 Tax=Candidatus Iainarchaeum sp. TaxID=3101447 RepID=A0A8T4LC38_9ARCH|nr:aspartate ammonia-lyase [Candidatus Diapherotrites archaeon]
MRFRVERDSLGKKKVPADAYYGVFTQRALENFPVSGWPVSPLLIESLLEIKLAAAQANARLGVLDRKKGAAIVRAAREALHGRFAKDFALDAFTAGGGTPWNMNANEVIANRANELLSGKKGKYDRVHPNDHVNLGQSSNDVIPTAGRLMALKQAEELLEGVEVVEAACKRKAKEFRRVLKSARTHLQDAVPITLGQEFAAYAEGMGKARKRIQTATESVRLLGIGGTAVGTGLNSHPRFAGAMVKNLRKITGLRLGNARNLVEATNSMADFVELMNAVEEYAIELNRLCNDLRLLASGPYTGFNELKLPEVEPGSSIMPGKVNPSVPEVVNMVCFQVSGLAHAVRLAAMGGQLELNVFAPSVVLNVGRSQQILANASKILARDCLRGIRVNKMACGYYFDYSAGIATALTPVLGYARAAEIVKHAQKQGKSVRQALAEESGLDGKQLRAWLNAASLTKPNLKPRK